MPRIIDQHHEVLTNMTLVATESTAIQFHNYLDALSWYGRFIQPYYEPIQRSGENLLSSKSV